MSADILSPAAGLQPADGGPVFEPPSSWPSSGEGPSEQDGKPKTPTVVIPAPSEAKRTVPKVFASPKKKPQQPPPAAPVTVQRESMRFRLRKALAPYLAASYWQGEVARKFTQEYIESNPPPENEGDLPAYIQTHLQELNRVTERWTGSVVKVLDPMSHTLAVDGRLQRQRDREEGLIPEEELPGGVLDLQRRMFPVDPHEERLGGSSYEYFALQQQPDSPGAGGAAAGEDRLTEEQLVSAVHLVSDVQVWKEILAAREAEERRQHAIAELHLHHAARIIQRSWRTFIRRKREEKARLDALVSPDVQAMLSAAAYKAMRDARNKLAVMKLRKSLSRRAKGFGSTAPRDIVPAPLSGPSRKNLHVQPHPPAPGSLGRRSNEAQSHGSRTRRHSMDSHGAGMEAAEGDDAEDDAQDEADSGEAGGSGTAVTAAAGDTEAAGAAGGAAPGEGAPGDGGSTEQANRHTSNMGKVKSFMARSAKLLMRLVSFKDPEAEAAAAARDAEGSEEGEAEGQAEGAINAAAAQAAARTLQDGRYAAVEDSYMQGGAGDAEDEDDGAGEGEGEAEEDEPDAGDDDEEPGEAGDEDDDDLGEGESVEDAMAEAEVVVQVAAELAEAMMGLAEEEAEDSEEGTEADSEASAEPAGGRAARAGPGAGAAPGQDAAADDSMSVSSVLAPPPLKAAAATNAAAPVPPPARDAAAGAGPRRRGSKLAEDSAVMRQVIAGALAAAAAPVLGRNGALTVAQLGLGAPLGARPKGGSPRTGAARLRLAAPAAGTGVVVPVPHTSMPLEIRAAAAVAAGMASPAGDGDARGLSSEPATPPPPPTPAADGCELALPALERIGSTTSGPLQPRVTGYVSNNTSLSGAAGPERSSPSMPPAQAPALSPNSRTVYGVDGCGGPVFSLRERRASSSATALPVVLPAVVGVSVPAAPTPSGDDCTDSLPAAVGPRQPRASLPAGLGAGFGSYSPSASPQASPDGPAAAAHAAAVPWAAPRHRAPAGPMSTYLSHAPHAPPPGSTTLTSSLPDPRGLGKETGLPRDPSWMLPPITTNMSRSMNGPPGLAPPHGAAAAGGSNATIAAMLRTASDPYLQRPGHLAAATGGSGGGAPTGHKHGVGALTAAATGGRMRRSSMLGGSVDGPLMPVAGGGGSVSPVRKQPRGGSVSPGRLAMSVEVKSAAGSAASFTAGMPGVQAGLLINGMQRDAAAQMARARKSTDTGGGMAGMAGAGGGANDPGSPALGSYTMLGGPAGPAAARSHAAAAQHGMLRTGLSPSVPRAGQARS